MPPKNVCRFCNRNAKTNVVKCVSCESELHKYCCEKNYIEINNETVKCCEENDEKFEDAMSADSDDTEVGRLRKEITYFKSLLREKNKIIADKCTIISDKEAIIKLLQDKITCIGANSDRNSVEFSLTSRISEPTNPAAPQNSTSPPTSGTAGTISDKRLAKPTHKQPINNKQIGDNVQAAHTENESSSSVNNDNGWSIVKPKKSNRYSKNSKNMGIVGSAKIENVSAVTKKSVLFVSRLSVQTQLDVLQNYVRNYFPEAECSVLKSKFPEHYSSYKIIVDSVNYEAAMDPEKWPTGAFVSKFFQKRSASVQKG